MDIIYLNKIIVQVYVLGKSPWYQKSHNKYINANTSLKGTKLFYRIIMYFYVKTLTITVLYVYFILYLEYVSYM